ncbi:anti-sigma factor [Acidovorax cavernicola]|uniref:RNA polymerase subunit sigma-70 n=1 Tax=Acidovorax cavernicola TaxID=1675792 RepID=A0A9X8CYP0_9BURK|nr:anti-sigma factor [Acidovorax cavernicola]RIX72308.1 RNA polymerase subunit sigma-70 [Acidovorax cavernicola]
MNLIQNPELLDRLAAAYALGTLRGGARRRFEQLAREHVPVRAAALLWQGRWSALSEVQAPVQPDAAVWTRIDNLLQAENPRAAQPRTVPAARLSWWRNAAWAGAFATVAAVAVGLWSHHGLRQTSAQQMALLQSQLQTAQAAPQIQYVAVLADGKQDPSMLVTFDARQNRLVLQRVGGFREGADQSLQLWALPPQGKPRSLGVLGTGRLEQLPAREAQVQAVPTLAISLEPKGGVPSETGPTGPVLFTGALIRRDL